MPTKVGIHGFPRSKLQTRGWRACARHDVEARPRVNLSVARYYIAPIALAVPGDAASPMATAMAGNAYPSRVMRQFVAARAGRTPDVAGAAMHASTALNFDPDQRHFAKNRGRYPAHTAEEAMYLTIRKYGGCGEVKEINRIAVAELLPELRKVAGFRSYTIVDTGSNSGLAIGMFDSRAAAEIANERARTVVMRTALKDLLPNPPEIIVGEVLSDSK